MDVENNSLLGKTLTDTIKKISDNKVEFQYRTYQNRYKETYCNSKPSKTDHYHIQIHEYNYTFNSKGDKPVWPDTAWKPWQ